jgi:hypothetical protein
MIMTVIYTGKSEKTTPKSRFSNILFRPEKRFRRVSVHFFSLCVLKRKEEIYGSSRSGSFL